MDDKNVPSEAPLYNWDTNEVSFNTDPLVDPRTGKNLVVRCSTFKFPPAIIDSKKKPSKQELFNSVAKQISDMLWKDGLARVEDESVAPKVSVGPNGFTVYITAEARNGVMWNDNARALEDIMKKK